MADAFERLTRRVQLENISVDTYAVEALDKKAGSIYLGCAGSGNLALIVATTPSKVPPSPLRLAVLSAEFGTNRLLSETRSEQSVRVSILECSVFERSVADLFATVCSSLADSLPVDASEQEFASQINQWSNLFWRLSQGIETDVVGLAGELVVLSCTSNPEAWLNAWHSRPDEVLDFDFIDSPAAIEVKTTRSSSRVHPISLDQLSASGIDGRYFASVQIELNDSGELLGELVRTLIDRLNSENSRLRLWDVLTKTCGSGLDDVLARRFNTRKALDSVRFCRADAIPAPIVSTPLPIGVSSVGFSSNLNLASEVALWEIEDIVNGLKQ